MPHAPSAAVPSPYLRQELHHHQHQHTHLHQHQQLLPTALAAAPPPAPAPLFPPPLFKDIPKIAAVESPFYRTAGIGLPAYIGYSPAGLIHPGLGGATPFMPPSHLTSFAPKVCCLTCVHVPLSKPSHSPFNLILSMNETKFLPHFHVPSSNPKKKIIIHPQYIIHINPPRIDDTTIAFHKSSSTTSTAITNQYC